MTPDRAPPDSPPSRKTNPTWLWFALGAIVLSAVLTIYFWVTTGSPKAVIVELQGPREVYVGEWKSGNTTYTIRADGDVDIFSYGDGSDSESEGYIKAFERDDILLSDRWRIKVTSPPHRVGDHFEMTADGLSLHREVDNKPYK